MSENTAPLGNNTEFVYSRRRKYALREAAAKLLPESRTAWCGTRALLGSTIDIMHSESGSYYHNLMMCESPWICPVCASKIAAEHRAELGDALSRWPGAVAMLTVTLQHDKDDDLAELLSALKDVWRRMKSGKWWQGIRAEFELAAYVTATEVTYGAAAGWHPHLHVLLFSRLPEHLFDRAHFKSMLFERYNALLEKHSHYASEYYGLNVRLGDKKAGDYISKYGLEWELANSTTKNGRGGMSPFELLSAYAAGAGWAGILFRQYAEVFYGTKQLFWSHDAKEIIGYRTFGEIAEESGEPGDARLMVLTYEQYKRILKAGAACTVLEMADIGDAWYVWQYLQDILHIIPERWQAEQFIVMDDIGSTL